MQGVVGIGLEIPDGVEMALVAPKSLEFTKRLEVECKVRRFSQCARREIAAQESRFKFLVSKRVVYMKTGAEQRREPEDVPVMIEAGCMFPVTGLESALRPIAELDAMERPRLKGSSAKLRLNKGGMRLR